MSDIEIIIEALKQAEEEARATFEWKINWINVCLMQDWNAYRIQDASS